MLTTHRDQSHHASNYDHRPGGINLVELQSGTEFAPDNFQLYLIEATDDFETPRHRHNFEQVRIMLDGAFEWSPGRVQQTGTVGYFCEGTFYTQKGRGRSEMLLLQVSGATGDGYMSPRQLRQGIEDLKSTGAFRDGLFRWTEDGEERSRDSYEAVWEHINGRALTYPRPRYEGPIMIHPEAFAWIEQADAPGVSLKPLGRFNERGLTIGMARVAAGATLAVDAAERPMLLYALSGSGRTDSGAAWREGSAFKVERGGTGGITADETATFYSFGIPTFA